MRYICSVEECLIIDRPDHEKKNLCCFSCEKKDQCSGSCKHTLGSVNECTEVKLEPESEV